MSEPCQNGGICTDNVNDYICLCDDGYKGENCEGKFIVYMLKSVRYILSWTQPCT